MDKTLIAHGIIDVFEEFLEDKGIIIDNPERFSYIAEVRGDTRLVSLANIFGSDYYFLEDKIAEILERDKNDS